MNKRNIVLAGTAVLFLAVVLGSVLLTQWPAGALTEVDNVEFGLSVFNQYGIAILMVGLVLFVSMLGGVFIAQEEKE